jgi:hypothetical protein
LDIHDFGEQGNHLIDELIAHRVYVIESSARRAQQRVLEGQMLDRVESLFEQAERARTPREARALRAEAEALIETIEASSIE